MEKIRMKQPSIFENIFKKLKDKDIPTINELKRLLSESEFIDLKTYTRIFSKTIFRVYKNELPENNVRQIMVLRRALYIDEPIDNDEYSELIEYFESYEDYESCQKINIAKNEYNKSR